MLKIGDEITVLDEDLSGRILKINNNIVLVETTDGFELEFDIDNIIKLKNDLLKSQSISYTEVQNALQHKDIPKKKIIKRKPKERYQPTMEVDLHIHQLTNSSRNMSNHDMLTLQLDTAKRQLDFAIKKRIQKIVFIHGVGEGVLKLELEYLFKRYDNIKFYDANYQKYGVGATEVYIYQSAVN